MLHFLFTFFYFFAYMPKFFKFCAAISTCLLVLPLLALMQPHPPLLLSISGTPNNWVLKCETKEKKTFQYSALPEGYVSAINVNDVPTTDYTFSSSKYKRGYFRVKTDSDSTQYQYQSCIDTKKQKPIRVMLYVEGTEQYCRTTIDNVRRMKESVYSKSQIELNTTIGFYWLHSSKMQNFATSIKSGDVIISCIQDTLTNKYTEKQKQEDGRLLLNTAAHHIVRLYEHFNIRRPDTRAGATTVGNTKALLWFEGKEDIFIDHTEKPSTKKPKAESKTESKTESLPVPAPYFIQQFKISNAETWLAIAGGMGDSNTVVKAWENGINTLPPIVPKKKK
jgi:hypothetical protein